MDNTTSKPTAPKIKFKPLKILTYPNPKLRRKSVAVKERNLPEIQKLIEHMFKTMRFYQGIGLAAPQVGVGFRVAVVDLQDGHTEPLALINPEIVKREGEMELVEGCLSFPHSSGHVQRSSKIEVRFLDYEGQEKTITAEGLLAACIQHEIDHINGILFIDHLSNLKRDMIIKRIKKRKINEQRTTPF